MKLFRRGWEKVTYVASFYFSNPLKTNILGKWLFLWEKLSYVWKSDTSKKDYVCYKKIISFISSNLICKFVFLPKRVSIVNGLIFSERCKKDIVFLLTYIISVMINSVYFLKRNMETRFSVTQCIIDENLTELIFGFAVSLMRQKLRILYFPRIWRKSEETSFARAYLYKSSGFLFYFGIGIRLAAYFFSFSKKMQNELNETALLRYEKDEGNKRRKKDWRTRTFILLLESRDFYDINWMFSSYLFP